MVDVLMCAHCGENPATCVGKYEAMTISEPACDECCGHACEDGHCDPIQDDTFNRYTMVLNDAQVRILNASPQVLAALYEARDWMARNCKTDRDGSTRILDMADLALSKVRGK